jgi:hypothetical protein
MTLTPQMYCSFQEVGLEHETETKMETFSTSLLLICITKSDCQQGNVTRHSVTGTAPTAPLVNMTSSLPKCVVKLFASYN